MSLFHVFPIQSDDHTLRPEPVVTRREKGPSNSDHGTFLARLADEFGRTNQRLEPRVLTCLNSPTSGICSRFKVQIGFVSFYKSNEHFGWSGM